MAFTLARSNKPPFPNGPVTVTKRFQSTRNIFQETARGPWSFKIKLTDRFPLGNSELQRHNDAIYSFARKRQLVKALGQANELKEKGITPNLDTFNGLIKACADAALPLECRALIGDMIQSGIEPNLESFNQLLHVNIRETMKMRLDYSLSF
jgi:pentatricopeptide repeat protein